MPSVKIRIRSPCMSSQTSDLYCAAATTPTTTCLPSNRRTLALFTRTGNVTAIQIFGLSVCTNLEQDHGGKFPRCPGAEKLIYHTRHCCQGLISQHLGMNDSLKHGCHNRCRRSLARDIGDNSTERIGQRDCIEEVATDRAAWHRLTLQTSVRNIRQPY